MPIAHIAAIAGAVLAVAYLVMVYRGFGKSKAEMAAYGGGQLGQVDLVEDHVFDSQESGLMWKAGIGLVLSAVVLWLITLDASVWYAVPFLALGTSFAVILAFLFDRDPEPVPAITT
ncbi:MAG: hypothetical protein AB7N54_12095 [Alphaproteobacteria bacterium]